MLFYIQCQKKNPAKPTLHGLRLDQDCPLSLTRDEANVAKNVRVT
jgi:hypothetical protein